MSPTCDWNFAMATMSREPSFNPFAFPAFQRIADPAPEEKAFVRRSGRFSKVRRRWSQGMPYAFLLPRKVYLHRAFSISRRTPAGDGLSFPQIGSVFPAEEAGRAVFFRIRPLPAMLRRFPDDGPFPAKICKL